MSSLSGNHKDAKEVPEVVTDVEGKKRYLRGKFLGKGGFARCYELTDADTRVKYAGKIVSKSMLNKKNQRDKMTQEIAIHRSLSHPAVVGFVSYFEDIDHVFVILELCPRRSLMELHKRRRAVTEPEARYFMKQLVLGTRYLHDQRVIHRDLKLGNLFLDDDLGVKIGDFGLATKLDYDGERKRTLCGTPNYIAPEMLNKKGHSYEVDIWAIGCILFTLLVGKPPFETQSLKDTYAKIKKNEYHIPSKVSESARNLIRRLLSPEPAQRPTIHEVIDFAFFSDGFLPTRLPATCLTMAPKFPSTSQLPPYAQARTSMLGDVNRALVASSALSPKDQARKDILAAPMRPLGSVPEEAAMFQTQGQTGVLQNYATNAQIPTIQQPVGADTNVPMGVPTMAENDVPTDFYLSDMFRQLTEVIHGMPERSDENVDEEESEDPAATPVFWISKWVDYSDKYGLGYQLCDNSVGVLFNDSTKIVLDGNGDQVQYIERDNRETYYTISAYPEQLSKKVTLLKYFRTYMNEHLLKAGANVAPRDGDELARLPCLRTWFRTRSAIVLHLNNGTLQINFFQDHTKVIICPLMGAITYINADREFRTFRLNLITKYGCSKDVFSRMRYARTMVERLLSQSATSRPGSLSTVANAPRHASNMMNMPSTGSASVSNIPNVARTGSGSSVSGISGSALISNKERPTGMTMSASVNRLAPPHHQQRYASTGSGTAHYQQPPPQQPFRTMQQQRDEMR